MRLTPLQMADIIFAAATDHIYLDGGHVVDFANKAFELLDHIGWEHAGQVLTSLVHGMATARRSEELNSWRHPVDISSLVWQAREELPALYEEGLKSQSRGSNEDELVGLILDDDPTATLEAIKEAIRLGASPESLASATSYASFLRMARFHTSNEFGDWDTVHNTLTAANALHQAMKRAPSPSLLRGVFDVAMSIYLDRFLNLPSQRIPQPTDGIRDREELPTALLERMDVQQQVEETAQIVSDYAGTTGSLDGVLPTLGHAMLREDSGFHSFQIVDAAFKQYRERRGTEAGRHVIVAMTRFLAAHAPTARAVDQTYNIAVRLNRGDQLYRDI